MRASLVKFLPILASLTAAFILAAGPALAQQYGGPGITGGIDQATSISGVSGGDVTTTVNNIVQAARSVATLVALVVIVIAGFYLILGLGDEGSKDKAKKIVLYTAIGLVIINIAADIVTFFSTLSGSPDTAPLRSTAITILIEVLNVVTFIAMIVLIIAGIRLIISGGDEGAKDSAKKTIIYVIAGLVLIFFARTIAAFFGDIG